jgi:hypothetical protein
VIGFVKENKFSLEQNVCVHDYNTRKKMDLHVLLCSTYLFKKGVINMEIQLYNKVPVNIKQLNKYKPLTTKFKHFLMNHAFYSINEFFCYRLNVMQEKDSYD